MYSLDSSHTGCFLQPPAVKGSFTRYALAIAPLILSQDLPFVILSTIDARAFVPPATTDINISSEQYRQTVMVQRTDRAARAARRHAPSAIPDSSDALDSAFLCTCSHPKAQLAPGRVVPTEPHAFLTGPDSIPVHASTINSTSATDSSPHAFLSHILQHSPSRLAYCFVDILPSGDTPLKLNQALASVDRKHWKFALDSEYDQLVDAKTWELVPRSEARNVISGKWVFKIKKNKDGSIDRYKARWVARGFSQKHDIDYTEVFAPVIRYSSVRLLLNLANAQNLDCYGLDISNAFARADVDEKLFVEMPHGYTKTDSSGHPMVCRLCKGLYGTKQAARLWHQTFRSRLLENALWLAPVSVRLIMYLHAPHTNFRH